MRDPRPLVEEDATDFERRLLLSARSEEPPPALVRQMERALGIGAGAVLASAAASSAAASSAAASIPAAGQVGQLSVASASASGAPASGGVAAVKLGAALKVAGVVGLVLAGAVGVNLLLPRGARETRRPAGREAAVVAPTPMSTPTPTELAPAPAAAPFVSPSGVNEGRLQRPGAGAALAARGAALRGEIALIDGARSALTGGALGRALRILDPRSPLAERVERVANGEESP